jgi:phage protein D
MIAKGTPIYVGQDFYVPYFQVKLQDRPLGQDVIHDITQVTYQDSVDTVASFELTVNNWDAKQRTFKYSDTDLFNPGKKVELWMGYYGRDRLRLMLVGKITSLRPTFPASGQPTLAVSGQNLLHHLRGKQLTRTYEDQTASQIARQVGKRMNVKVRTDPAAEAREERYKHIMQHNEFDIVFLMRLAERHGYDIFVEERGQNGQAGESSLYFGPPVSRSTVYNLDYGSSLIDFTPNLSTSNQVKSVRSQGWDNENKRRLRYTSQINSLATQPLNAGRDRNNIQQSFADREDVISRRPVNSQQEAQTQATETHERIIRQMLTGSGSTVGLPDLRAGNFVRISGVGERFSGKYFVTATTHNISDSGYTTKFDGRREEA